MGAPMVTTVVVTYNRRTLLEECIAAIGRQTYAPQRVIVVDNASTDDTGEFLDQLSGEQFQVIRLPENTGGAGGFAHGIRVAAERPADLIWIMDDDCIPAAGALEELVRAGQQLDREGFAYSFLCSRVVDMDGIACNHPVPSSAKNASGWPRWADLAHKGLVVVDECTFVSVAASVEHVRRAGLPFRQMFIWGDDTEYTRRLSTQAPGVLIGTSEVLHKRVLAGELCVHTESSPGRLPFYRHHYRNRIYLYRKYFPRGRYAAFLAQIVGDLAKLIGHGRFRRAALVGRGLVEGLFFRPTVEPVDGEPSAALTRRK